MGNVTELRVALTVEDFDGAVAFYRDALGLEQIADWSTATGRVVVLEAGGGEAGVGGPRPGGTGGGAEGGPPGGRHAPVGPRGRRPRGHGRRAGHGRGG